MKKNTLQKLLLLSFAALLVLLSSCKKEELDENTSHVRVALTGARIDSTFTGSILSRDITVIGTFISPTDFNVSEYGVVFYSSSNPDPANIVGDSSAGRGRTSPGAFEFKFKADGKENLYVGLYAVSKNGTIYSVESTKVQDILDGVAFLPILEILMGPNSFSNGSVVNYGTINQNGFFVLPLVLHNAGLAQLEISSIVADAGLTSCTLSTTSMSISPGAFANLDMTFNASVLTDGSTYSGQISMITNDSSRVNAFVTVEFLYDYIPQGVLQLDDKGNSIPVNSIIDFSSANAINYSLKNIGDAVMTVNSITFSSSDYNVSFFTPGSTVNPGGYINAQINRLNNPPLLDATMFITTDFGNYTYTLSTTAPGAPVYEFRENSTIYADFSSFEFYGSPTKTFEIHNTGNADLTGINAYTDNANFTITTFPLSSISAPGATQLTITCYSSVTESANLYISTANGGSHQYTLNYTSASGSPIYDLRLGGISQANNSTFDFTSTSQLTFEIYNTGTADLNVTSVTSSNPNFPIYSLPAPTISAAGLSNLIINCNVSSGTESSTLTISTDAGTFSYQLVYSEPMFEIRDESSVAIADGSTITFNGSQTKTWSFANTGGGVISIYSITTTGGFTNTTPANTVVISGGQEAFDVTAPAGGVGTITVSTSIGTFTCNIGTP